MSSTSTLEPPDVDATAGVMRPRRRPLAGSLVACLGLAAAGAAGWWLVAGERLDDVHVVAAPDGVSCSVGQVDRDVPPVGDPRGPGYPVPVVQAAPGMACSVTLLVVNRGGSDVVLERVTVPGMGPSSRGAAQVFEVSPYGPLAPPPPADGYEAAVEVRDVLAPGDVREVALQLAYNTNGCSTGGVTARPDGPFLTVRALGRSTVRSPVLPPFAFSGTAAGPDCPSD